MPFLLIHFHRVYSGVRRLVKQENRSKIVWGILKNDSQDSQEDNRKLVHLPGSPYKYERGQGPKSSSSNLQRE